MAKPKSPLDGDLLLIDRHIEVRYMHPDDLDDAAGDANWSAGVINIATGLKLPIEKQTVMHELVHIIDESFGIGLKENQVQALSIPLARLVADNPQLIAYLTKKEEP